MSLLEHELRELAVDLDRETRASGRERADHEARLRVLERLGFRLLAWAGVGGGIGATVAGLLSYYLAHAAGGH